MGKGLFEQESGVVGIQLQAQVINSHGKSPLNTVTVGMSASLSSYPVVLPGKFPKFTTLTKSYAEPKGPSSIPPYSQPTGSFPDTQPPVSLSFEMCAFPENDNFFLRSLEHKVDSSVIYQYMYRLNPIKAKGNLRQCPIGKQGGGGSGSPGSSPSGAGNCYSMWGSGSQATGGGSGGGLGGSGGGDDPNNDPFDFNSLPADKLFDVDEFNVFDYLDPAIEDIFREISSYEDVVLPANPGAGSFNQMRDYHQSYPTDPSDRSTTDPPSTPAAPMTPSGGLSFPMTPMPAVTPMGASQVLPNSSNSMLVSSPSCTSVEQSDHSDNTQDLLEIHRLMINSGAGSSKPVVMRDNTSSLITTPMGHSSTTLVPQQASQAYQHLTQRDTHVPTIRPTRPTSIMATPQQLQHQINKENYDIDFLTTNMYTAGSFRCIELYVPFNLSPDKSTTGYNALQHNYKVYMQFQEALKDCSLFELQVTNNEIAKLCTMELPPLQSPKICFKMPKTCVPLSTWINENHSVLKRQLVIQQTVNTLTILFKAQNELCFWGSYQIWVDTDYRVYLYIDFIKALAIQKEYIEKMIRSNPRVEDCKVLMEVYNTVLKPYLQVNATWISPELCAIFTTFEDILKSPEACVSRMADVARVLGNRRICQLRVQLMIGTTFDYDIFCAEHEKLSTAIELVSPMLPAAIARQWAVVRCHDNSPVGMHDIAVKKAEASYFLIPLPENFPSLPGALYIKSNQSWSS